MSCPQVLKATSYTATATELTIVVDPSVFALYNGKIYHLLTCVTLPVITSIVPVFISINGTTYPVMDCIGNNLMSDQVKSRHCYKMVFGTNPNHFKLCEGMCKSAATVSRTVVPAATA